MQAMEVAGSQQEGARVVARAWVDADYKRLLLRACYTRRIDLLAAARCCRRHVAVHAAAPAPAAAATAGVCSTAMTAVRLRRLASSSGDGAAACAELGIEGLGSAVHLTVVENTNSATPAAVHNLVVCTLCSCYPVALLGFSPDWYKSRASKPKHARNS